MHTHAFGMSETGGRKAHCVVQEVGAVAQHSVNQDVCDNRGQSGRGRLGESGTLARGTW